MGSRKRNRGRSIDGLLLLNKPGGETSNRSLQRVKRLFDANKAGHTGSLDPLATGLLPICFGEATKFTQFLLNANKTYSTDARLGVVTDSGDSDGQVLERQPVPADLDEPALLEVLSQFQGEISQVPSMFSALKHNGQPLYKLARQGIEVERKSRLITIHSIALQSLQDDSFEMEVHCSKGTYIRTLVEDVGQAIGCGAHVTRLHRLSSGLFSIDDSCSIDEIEALVAEGGMEAVDRLLLPIHTMVADWPKVVVGSRSTYGLKHGQPVAFDASLGGLEIKGNAVERVQIWSVGEGAEEVFLGVGELHEGVSIVPKRLIQTET
ncbi:MAG: tRNA pseudouridine(55) synthase TruB [Gammaproteobacteria bacterium]|nr:MAG: tRNA pseudouridine(55) synthase TruB [Gammaproteobacteria bacterium]